MKLRKLFVAELALVFTVLIVIVVVVEVNPALGGSTQSQDIGAFNQKLFSQGAVSITRATSFSTSFDYSSYEPAVLVIDLKFSTIQSPGTLSATCNGRYIGSVYAADKSHATFSAISMSGTEWVKPPSAYSSAFTNQIIFSSDADQGFEGIFTYQISLRGSR